MSLRNQVLKSFKELHRTTQKVFNEDTRAVIAARNKINDEYKKYKTITDEKEVLDRVKLAEEVCKELKQNVIQAVEKEPGIFEAKITDQTQKLDNVIFKEDAIIPPPKNKKCK